MLTKETIDKLAKIAKLDASDLQAKIKSEREQDITLQELEVFTKPEFDERIKNEKGTSYTEGKNAGIQMLVKEKKKQWGYDFDGKDFDSFINHHTKKLKLSFGKPNEKVIELENDIKKLNKTHQDSLTTLEAKYTDTLNKYNSSRITNELLSIMPENTVIPKQDLVVLFNSNYEVVKEDEKTLVKRDGQTIKDNKTASPLTLKDAFMNFAIERKYISNQPGRGKGNEFGVGVKTNSISKFQQEMAIQGIELNSPEYEEKYTQWRKEQKEVVA